MLIACCDCSKQRVVEYEEEIPVFATDTTTHKDSVNVTPEKQTDRPATVPASSSSSSRATKQDNMRGFDPASEDDMDDNGMSRYFDNNDDEGWD